MNLRKYIYDRTVRPILSRYLKRTVQTSIGGLKLRVVPGVFHPKFFFSTPFFFSFINGLPLKNKKVLEVGCGSGALSLLALQKGANVTAIDIDERAVTCTEHNLKINFSNHDNIRILKSDLFADLKPQVFDLIIINPPYFFKNVNHPDQWAWNCGEQGEYFHGLFSGIGSFIGKECSVYLVLAENCDLNTIRSIANKYGYLLKIILTKKIKWENNFILKLETDSHR